MDTRFLRSLLAVIDSGSIAEAARIEGLTAAAIGQRIQALERTLGVALLSRNGHTARPTEACLNLLPRAREVVRAAALLASDADPLLPTGTLRIGAISTALTGMMPRALRELTRSAPGIRPSIVPGTSRELYQGVVERELDAALLVMPPFALPKTVTSHTLRREPLHFICATSALPPPGSQAVSQIVSQIVPPALPPAMQPASQAGQPEQFATPGVFSSRDIVAQLRDFPYIRYDPRAWGGRHAAQFLADQDLQPTVVCDLDALETIVMLVADGVGVSLLPHWPGAEKWISGCAVIAVDEGESDRYAREIVLLHGTAPDRPRMVAALRHALGVEARPR